jgi:methylenetetrahydrofolate dehydrogenase (NADP+)/methenyltetrahydrofolate cyclohydrolase/formyltetrahydrofolate synthetase/formate--tetrahydrofolate ligase
VHAGPFANIAHGNSSILADMIATNVADYVVTESGFGSDMGFEKFMDIKCRSSGMMPDAVVIVATVRALKMQGGGPKVVPGKPLSSAYTQENVELLKNGLANLKAHIGIVQRYGLPVVVAINNFPTDTEAEHALMREAALEAGAVDAVVAKNWALGGEGAADLARAVERAASMPSNPKFLYPSELSIKEKIETVATQIYGAGNVVYSPVAEEAIAKCTELGYSDLPICMAKTQYSLSDNPKLLGAPKNFEVKVNEVKLSNGAGFIVCLTGDIMTMPGLPKVPAANLMDIDEEGNIVGLF